MFYGFYDPTFIILIPAILLSMYASIKVNTTTKKYFEVRASKGMTGQEVARRILDHNGLRSVPVYAVEGNLTDHYDPRNKTVSLSKEVYYGTSITSVSVAAHECGHAIQDQVSYAPMLFRSAIVPVVNFASSLSWIIIMAGFFFIRDLLWIGIILFSATVIFQIVTLPVEFNASSRALAQLETLGILGPEEKKQGTTVLRAAALTYVAAALSSALQLLRLILIARDRD
ncbi:zinc metallopeptidase [Peptostreptococcus canis]|uniref:Zinc metallopeptidase n=1 Tax=Peptostreptococcus canis TaxID=1159213 RepID=A0ABR6TKH1_9FIRM|nr:zinc metallopeptidase [Peptostreptococcus canis]MBC2575643.1 zinc metallopeptidase [Peptostreptococcus canis]MBP1997152.1 Zn-dependent membrane protease YugP [Peptostreptococcus canis]